MLYFFVKTSWIMTTCSQQWHGYRGLMGGCTDKGRWWSHDSAAIRWVIMEENSWRSMAGVRHADDRPIKYLKEEERLNSKKYLTSIGMMVSTVGFCLKRNVVEIRVLGQNYLFTIQFEAIETDLRNGLGAKLRILDLRQAQFLVTKLANWMTWCCYSSFVRSIQVFFGTLSLICISWFETVSRGARMLMIFDDFRFYHMCSTIM